MKRNDIIDAYVFLRKNNQSIPDKSLEFMKDAALSAYDSLHDDYCKKCQHNGSQMQYPSNCTGCGSDGEKLHFKMAIQP